MGGGLREVSLSFSLLLLKWWWCVKKKSVASCGEDDFSVGGLFKPVSHMLNALL
jgi:hypothetical protein